MSTDLEARFNRMLERVKNEEMEFRPDQRQKLQLYAHFKQATEGDVVGECPGITQFVERTKFKSWEKLQGMSKDEAMQAYLDLFISWGVATEE